MLDCDVSNSTQPTINDRWQRLRPRLTQLYTVVALILLIFSVAVPVYLLNQPGTVSAWWQIYGRGLLAGICWLVVGGILLGTAGDWSEMAEGLTLLPPALLLLLLDGKQGYIAIVGATGLFIVLHSLLRITNILSLRKSAHQQTVPLSPLLRDRVNYLLTRWIATIGLAFCLGLLPILLTERPLSPLPPLPLLYLLITIYPLIYSYVIRLQRLANSLQLALTQQGEKLQTLEQTEEGLRQSNNELQHSTSLLLQADARLRALLSQRLHDQPKQQALRIRSLLAHWQYKLHVEAERDANGKVAVQPIIEVLSKVRKISEELEGDLRGLQLLVEDVYQRRSLGLRQHLEKLIREDLPTLYPSSPLKVQADLWALDTLDPRLEQTEEGAKIAEAISYTVTQALLNVYQHAGAKFATVRATNSNSTLAISIHDDGHGFDLNTIPFEKTSLFKARLKARETGGWLTIESVPRTQIGHGTTVILYLPLPEEEQVATPDPQFAAKVQDALESP
jgi:signal transduction histidine kinase